MTRGGEMVAWSGGVVEVVMMVSPAEAAASGVVVVIGAWRAWTSGSSRSGGGERFGARPEFWPEMVAALECLPESMAAAVVVGG
ncbi:hypothetical protein Tco_0040873 [Tanacetum coccineum]